MESIREAITDLKDLKSELRRERVKNKKKEEYICLSYKLNNNYWSCLRVFALSEKEEAKKWARALTNGGIEVRLYSELTQPATVIETKIDF